MSVEELKKQVEDLQNQLHQLTQQQVKKRHKIEKMTAEVVDSNPYR